MHLVGFIVRVCICPYAREDKNMKESVTLIFKERICECTTIICFQLDVLIKRTVERSLQSLRMSRSPANCSLQDRSFLKHRCT